MIASPTLNPSANCCENAVSFPLPAPRPAIYIITNVYITYHHRPLSEPASMLTRVFNFFLIYTVFLRHAVMCI
jgi:hypothetical protein